MFFFLYRGAIQIRDDDDDDDYDDDDNQKLIFILSLAVVRLKNTRGTQYSLRAGDTFVCGDCGPIKFKWYC